MGILSVRALGRFPFCTKSGSTLPCMFLLFFTLSSLGVVAQIIPVSDVEIQLWAQSCGFCSCALFSSCQGHAIRPSKPPFCKYYGFGISCCCISGSLVKPSSSVQSFSSTACCSPAPCVSLSSLGPAPTARSMSPHQDHRVKMSVLKEGVRSEDAVGTGPAPGEMTEWLWGAGVLGA